MYFPTDQSEAAMHIAWLADSLTYSTRMLTMMELLYEREPAKIDLDLRQFALLAELP